ncbi:MAG TPA: SDR family oxidoreductase [Stellaceae bacterium]|nr:SDR family oxidoreductase [Stellaceae bacterium]
MTSLSVKVCLVTGASRGIGAATARLAAQRGYAVGVNYRAAADSAQAVVAEIKRNGGRAVALRGDVSRADEVEAVFAALEKEFGPVTALVNNAAIASARRPIWEFGANEIRAVIDTNLIGSFLCAQQAAKRMARTAGGNGGVIVNVSSAAVRTGGHRLSLYVAAKAGIEGLTVSLARDLAMEGIRVNAVSPGVIATDQQPLHDESWKSSAAARIPIGRLGTADEVAEAIVWLMSDEASYISGTVLAVAGGS